MVVNTVGEQGYLRSGLADMLASRLGRNPAVAVVRLEEDAQATTDPLRASEIALQHGARFVVFGSFTQFGEGASLDLQCLEAREYEEDEDPRARRVFIQSGKVGEIIPQLDATAQKIALFVAGPAPADPLLPAVAASSDRPAGRVVNEAGVEDLRRRVEAIEDYLFAGDGPGPAADLAPGDGPGPAADLAPGDGPGPAADLAPGDGASQEFRLR
jgi:hypothetical protein